MCHKRETLYLQSSIWPYNTLDGQFDFYLNLALMTTLKVSECKMYADTLYLCVKYCLCMTPVSITISAQFTVQQYLGVLSLAVGKLTIKPVPPIVEVEDSRL